MKIRITQISRVERWIEIDVENPQIYFEGDFITPDSDDPRWNDYWDLQNETVTMVNTS